MKKIIAILLAAALCFGLTACKANPKLGVEGDDTAGEILVWLDNETWAEALIAAFNEKFPNIKVNFEQVGAVDARAKLMNDGPANIGCDVLYVPHDHIGLAIQDGLIEPIPSDLQKKYENQIVKSAVETVSKDGKMYGLPVDIENIALFYNKDLYTGKVPTTFEQIIEFAKTYNNAAENKWALAWQVDDAYHNFPFLTAFGFEVFGKNHDDYKTPGFDSAEAKKGVEFHMSLRSKVFDVPVAESTWDFTIGRFQKGEIPFTITGPWAIEECVKNGINFGVTKLPTINGKQPIAFSGVKVALVSSYSKNKELAYKFIDFMASPEGATIEYETMGKMPALKDASIVPGLADDKYLAGVAEQSPYTMPMPTIPEVQQMWDGLKNLFTFTWDGTMTADQAQAKAMETYETLLQAAGKTIK